MRLSTAFLSTTLALPLTMSADAAPIDFHTQVKPILESACFNCHHGDNSKGGLDLSTLELALEGGDNGPSIVIGKPEESSLYITTTLGIDDDEVMPPKKEGLLAPSQIAILKQWIEEGAKWPEDAVLTQKPRIRFEQHVRPILQQRLSEGGPLKEDEAKIMQLWAEQGHIWPAGAVKPVADTPAQTKAPEKLDGLELVKRIHAHIVATSKTEAANMANYEETVSKAADAKYQMVAIQGGQFVMGSPDSEPKRSDDEGPQVTVKVKPFWMGKTEIPWDIYSAFMITEVGRNKDGSKQSGKPDEPITEIVSQPTTPYVEMSFGMGTTGYPAISMTQHAANKFCQWLSAQTGHFYRLPTEQEWEYAARAGTTTAYYWGDDAEKAKEHEWFFENAENFGYAKVGQKKPNPWGLHDMLGNVAEWTLDQYIPEYFKNLKAMSPEEATGFYVPSTKSYPQSVRGGSFDDDLDRLRASARRGSDPSWKQQDPQLPKSIWYHTDARFLGFRIVRPLEIPSPEEMYRYWNNGVEKD